MAQMRFQHYVGFVSPPACFDQTLQQFLGVCADPVGVVQTLPNYPGAEYGAGLGDASRRLAVLKDGIAALRDADVEVVLQFGGYWALPYAPDLDSARALEQSLSEEFGIPVILNWTAIVDALNAVGAKRISVTTGYYRPAWTRASIAFLDSAGFEILWTGDLIDQDILSDQSEKEAIEDATRWDYPDEIVMQTCVEAARLAPNCDAICQTGAGMRTSYVVKDVEAQTGKPLVATDIAIFWAAMQATGITARADTGVLLSSTC